MRFFSLILLGTTFIIACSNGVKINSPKASEEFLSSIKEIPLESKNTSDSCNYSLTYFPPEVNFLKTQKGKITKTELANFESHKYDVVLFLLDITPTAAYKMPTGKSFESHMTRDESKALYIIEQVRNDMMIKSKTDSIKPIFYHYEKMFGMYDRVRLQVGFEKKILEMENPHFFFTNRLLSKPEGVKIPIDIKSIKQIPPLAL